MVTHRLRRAARAFVPVLAALWALGACAVTQDLTVRADRSGETAIIIELTPEVVARIQEMAALANIELPGKGVRQPEEAPRHLGLPAGRYGHSS